MADIADNAQVFEAAALEAAMAAQSAAAANYARPAATGVCLYSGCAEELDGPVGRLFCGAACADRYAKQTAAQPMGTRNA